MRIVVITAILITAAAFGAVINGVELQAPPVQAAAAPADALGQHLHLKIDKDMEALP